MAAIERPPQDRVEARTSIRCAECHGKMEGEWKHSAHARAYTSETFAAYREAAGEPEHCNFCHAPLWAYVEPPAPEVSEGVTCDVCHTIRKVDLDAPPGKRFELAVTDMVKFGPLCDAEDHYFHRMGCSPLHRTAELCGACHQWTPTLPSGEGTLPVFTTYADWKESPAAAEETPCQDCHMPGELAEVAEGSPPRENVPHHSFMGGEQSLRTRAVTLTVKAVPGADDLIDVHVEVENHGAGHPLPTGLPARRIYLRARTVSEGGDEMGSGQTTYGRVLLDAEGREAPFIRAVKVGSDNRIAPGAAVTERFSLRAPAAGTVEVDVVWAAFSRPIAAAVELASVPAEETMASARIPFGAPREAGGRAQLPKTLKVEP